MKTLFKFLGYGFLLALILLLSALAYVKWMLPNVGPAPELVLDYSEEQIERGRYLANHVMVCIDCHSSRDFSLFSGPPMAGTEGGGGERFPPEFGFPGTFIAPNITPHSLEDWSDGEIFRAVTTGVNKDGLPLFDLMPYKSYGKADVEDIHAVIAYIRGLEPKAMDHPRSEPVFPFNFILHTLPEKQEPMERPSEDDLIAYGAYLTTIAACADCHTAKVEGRVVGEPFAGGFEFRMPDGSLLRSPNITPHPTGIGNWTEEQFIRRFKQYTDSTFTLPHVEPGEFQTLMPWAMYGGMEEKDLRAIYHYLKSLEPVENSVVYFEPGS